MRINRTLLLLTATVGVICGQTSKGTITGIITDPSGANLVKAKVTALAEATGVHYTTESTEAGNYFIAALPAGTYRLQAEAAGFKRFVQRGIEIRLGDSLNVPIQLEIGQVEQSVEVTAAAGRLETATSDLGTTVSREKVVDLPLAVSGAMRNPEAFAFLAPGVSGNTSDTNINGSQTRGKEVMFDGAAATTPESGGVLRSYPTVESLDEFKLIRGNFSAEYGRNGGGVQVFSTKSGTNEYHASFFEYLRNNAFDARGFFARSVAANRQNEFGMALGGPLRIPGLYNGKNRTFFRVVYSGFRFRQEVANQFLSVAPADFRQGDFSRLTDRNGALMPIYDPATTVSTDSGATRTPFAGNRIPVSRFSKVSQKILPVLPDLETNQLLDNFAAAGVNKTDTSQVTLKLDEILTERHRFGAFFFVSRSDVYDPQGLPSPLTGGRRSYSNPTWGRATYDWVASSRTINQLLVAGTRENGGGTVFSADQNWPAKLGLTGVNTGPGNVFPIVTFSDGYTSWGEASGGRSRGGQINNMMQLTDTLSHTRGKHTLKAGIDMRWLQTNGAEWLWDQGQFSYSSFTTAMPTAAGRANSGSSFASFLLGDALSAFRRVQDVFPANRYKYLGLYLQDDWKVTGRLTLNLGVRYEINFPRYEPNDALAGFVPDLANPAAGGRPGAIGFLGNGPGRMGRHTFADTDYTSVGPRFGFAYQIAPKTVLRGGYGLFFAPGNATSGLRTSTGFSYGYSAQPTYSSTDLGITSALNWDNGFPTSYPKPPFIDPTVANGANVNMIGRNDGRPPYIQDFSFGVQRELPGSATLEATYSGSKGTRLGSGLIRLNELSPDYLKLGSLLTQQVTSTAAQAAGVGLPYPGFTGSVAQALRPFPQYLNIDNVSNPNGNSTYHSLQTFVQKRSSKGLTLTAAFTWSKMISDSNTQAGGGPGGQTFYNRRAEKAISSNDVPRIFVLSYLYDLPFGPGRALLNRSRLTGMLVGGWTLSAIHQYSAGTPLSVSATNTLAIFNGSLRPDAVAGQNKVLNFSDPARDQYINAAAFQAPAPGQLGSAARGYTDLRRFSSLNENVGLQKRIRLTEHGKLIFRAEFFNVFNRVVFAAPAANISNSNFGRVTAQGNTPRQGQLALRIEY